MKHLNSEVKEGRIYLEVFPDAKANQLNPWRHSNVRGIKL